MNNDLISRESLRKAFYERIYYFDKSSWDEANTLIDNAPTIEERPQGKWIFIDEEWFDWKCSQCGHDSVHSYNFCPNCGAKMNTASTGETPEANK